MSKAYKCDRCGVLYVGYTISANDLLVHKGLRIIDLCPECYHGLKRWFELCEKRRDIIIEEAQCENRLEVKADEGTT